MTTNFRKLDKFEGHDFRRWQKKMHFLLTTLKVVYVLTTPMPELLEDATVELLEDATVEAITCRGHILNAMSDSLFDVYTNVESAKELWDSLESKYMAEDSSKESKNKNNKQNKGKKRDFKEHGSGSGSNKKPKLECWKCGKTGHFKRDCRSGNRKNANAGGSGRGSKDYSQDQRQNLEPV
ncbi:zinc finger, CCHC-type containing protein [Tanacetum coccineum]